MSGISLSASTQHSKRVRPFVLPMLAGILAALAMVGLYLGILSALQSPTHAVEQLATDGVWVGLVALGFGTQIGMYTHLRIVVHAAKAAGATAVTGAGTGTSTLGMLACCAHHLTDLAPLVALAGASGLSGAIGFLTEWKYAFIGLGLVMNAIGIVVTLRTLQKARAHLDTMNGSTVEMQSAPACH
jgi:FtsH-binding integral membrane protein